MKKIVSLAAIALAMVSTVAFASQKRKVLILGLDGLRSDALQQANTPNLDQLIANGFYTYDSWCLGITVSGPSWSTIFTGVWYQKHGVTDNSYAGSQFNTYPYFTKRAKEVKPNLYAVEIVDWAPMSTQVYNDGYNQKIIRTTNDLAAMLTATKVQLQNPDLDVLTLHPDNIDMTGHSSGFSPSNAAYMNAINQVDTWIGDVLTALKSRPTYNDEDWLILVVTDHGGLGTSHGGNSDEERHIWWVASGNNVKHKQIFAEDPGSFRIAGSPVDTNKLKKAPVQADIAVTALHHLIYDSGIRPDNKAVAPGSAWNLDGKSWLDSLMMPQTPTSVRETASKLEAKIYPNPASGLITLWLDAGKDDVAYQVTDITGRVVKQASNLKMDYKLNIDLCDQPAGTYLISVQAGNRQTTKQIVLSK